MVWVFFAQSRAWGGVSLLGQHLLHFFRILSSISFPFSIASSVRVSLSTSVSFCFLVSPIHSGSSFPPCKFSVHFVFCPLLVLSSMHHLPLPRLFSFYFFYLPLYFNKSYPVHLSHSSLFLSCCFFFSPYLSHKVSRTPHTTFFILCIEHLK